MKSKEEIRGIIDQNPSSKSGHREPPQVSTLAGRVFVWLLILFGVACLVLTEQISRALPFILGGNMALIGLNHIVCGLWTEEYQSRETKFTANGIVYLALGVVILCHFQNADSVIGSVWGMLGLMKGSESLNAALYSPAHKEHFVLEGLRSVIELVLGFLLLLDPSATVQHHVFLLGLELIVIGWQTLRERSK